MAKCLHEEYQSGVVIEESDESVNTISELMKRKAAEDNIRSC